MKKVAFILFLFLFITTKTMAGNMGSADELIDIASFVTSHELEVEKWEVTIKEKMNQDNIQEIIHTLSSRHKVEMKEDENSTKYLFRDTHNSVGVAIIYNVIIPKDGRYQAELTAVITGASWNKSMKESYQSQRDLISHQLFTTSAKLYTCLTTQNDAIIESDRFLREFTYYLNIQRKETQFDNESNSTHRKNIYGYTSLWEQGISINGTQMNVQIAVAKGDNGKQKYTIGTPILINEY